MLNPDGTLNLTTGFRGALDPSGWRMDYGPDGAPGRYTIWDRNIELTVLVDVIVGPEAGDQPDLVITDVDAHESGQLRIHVFNNAAPLESQALAVNLVRISTNEQIEVRTWQNVSIPSGGWIMLQSSDLVMEPYDLRVILDPSNQIPEMSDRNNIFETPVVMRVEFLRVFAPHCNENSCSIFDCDSEHVFNFWAGYGPTQDEVAWMAHNVRFPASGELIACGHDICMDHDSPDEDWRMEGDARYAFEFEMPATQNLYVMVTGYEHDYCNDNDSLGRVQSQYTPSTNWGARSDAYEASYGREAPCDDTFCTPCPDGLSAWWRVTRVH